MQNRVSSMIMTDIQLLASVYTWAKADGHQFIETSTTLACVV